MTSVGNDSNPNALAAKTNDSQCRMGKVCLTNSISRRVLISFSSLLSPSSVKGASTRICVAAVIRGGILQLALDAAAELFRMMLCVSSLIAIYFYSGIASSVWFGVDIDQQRIE